MVTSAGDLVILSINSPSEGEEVYSKMITVLGTAAATEGRYIVSVTVNNSLAGKETWSDDISLYEGWNTIKIVATDNFGNEKMENRTVYYIAPTPTQPPRDHEAPSATPTPPPTGSISITSTPPGAEVYLDGSLKGITNITLENVTVGSHEIKVTKEGFGSEREYKYVKAGRTEELHFELEPRTRPLFVFSTPPGASVHLDDDDMNKSTPCVLKEVAVGLHIIKLTKSGYSDGPPRNKYVSADEQNILHVTLGRCGSINISSNPPGAKVYLDGNDTGETTPANISKVALGNRIIKLTKFGYYNNETKVDVSVAKTYHVTVNLSGYGYINITSKPSGATMYLDGNYKGETPKKISKVVGNYSIRVTEFGYEDGKNETQVSAGETTIVHVELSPTFWERLKPCLIAVGAVGAIITAIATGIIASVELKKFFRRRNE
jgi:hypothetical protein